MHALVLQDWITVGGTATAVVSVTQGMRGWLDVARYADLSLWVDVREVTTPSGVVTLSIETAPSRDGSLFALAAPPIPVTAATSATLTKTVRAAATATVGRWLRWRLSTSANTNGSWDATFRIVAGAAHNSFFAPTDLGSCVLWLRADLGVTPSGSNVTQWNDQSGNGANVSAPVGSGPQVNAVDAAYSGQTTLSFDAGKGEYLTGSYASSLAQPVTVYLVGQMAVDAVNNPEWLDGNNANRLACAGSVTNDYPLMYAGTSLGATSGAMSSKCAICYTFNGSSSSMALNAVTPQTTGNAGTGGPGTAISLASLGGAAPFMTGKIAEVLVYGAAHTAAQRQQVLRYLGGRYAIAIGP
jgi:LSD1 subclass zinc finger protein